MRSERPLIKLEMKLKKTANNIGNELEKAGKAIGEVAVDIGQGINNAAKALGNEVKKLGEDLVEITTDLGKVVVHGAVQVGKFAGQVYRVSTKKFVGAMKALADSEIGKWIGKAAMTVWEFAKCAVPVLAIFESCVQQAIKSVGSCNGDDCHMVVCLRSYKF